jgi:hypothetical protein
VKSQDAPPLILDVSNVCRDKDLEPVGTSASWSRLEALVSALEASEIEYLTIYYVADRSLHYSLDLAGQKAFRRLEREGVAEQRRFADERIVELAFGSTSDYRGALVATCDYFDEFRRSYPEIQPGSGRAVRWRADDTGAPIPHLTDFGNRTHHRMSAKEEKGELAERRLRRRSIQEKAFAAYFRCTNDSCLVARLWPERLQELPHYDEETDTFVCPSCGGQLDQLGRRLPAVQLIVYLDGAERSRLLLESGNGLDIGRADAKGCIGLDRFIPTDRVRAISRRHLHTELQGTRVTIRDLKSKNGTLLRRRLAETGETRSLPVDRAETWALRDVVVLPGGISIERSGRRHPMVGERLPESTGLPSEVGPTTHS